MPYLAPVVIEVQGDSKPWQRVLAEVKAELADLAKDKTDVPIGGDSKPLQSDIAADKIALADLARSVTTPIIGDDSKPLISGIAADTVALAALGKTVTTPKIDGDEVPLETALARAQIQLAAFAHQVANAKLGADSAPFWADIARIKAWLSMNRAMLDVDADIKPALAKLLELKGAFAMRQMETLSVRYVPAPGSAAALASLNRSLRSAFPASYTTKLDADEAPFTAKVAAARAQLMALARTASTLKVDPELDTKKIWAQIAGLNALITHTEMQAKLGAKVDWAEVTTRLAALKAVIDATKLSATIGIEVAGAGKAGGGGALLLTLLGLGAGGRGAWTGLPKAGTLLAFGGLGLEHFVMTLVGMIGTAIGGMLGGLALALGNLGITGVGMGSSALVGSSTIADIQSMYKLLAANPKTTYAAAMKQIGLPQDAGTQAEWQQAQAVVALNSYWDTATSSARVAATHLYSQFLQVARTYIPLINTAATNNFNIISKSIKPLLAWLQSPTGGVGIFNQLEKLYAARLPTAVSTFTNALEVLFKTIAYVAPKTGGFLKSLNTFFGNLNTPAGMKTFESGKLTSWITDFHTLTKFIKSIYDTVRDLFRADKAHTGRAVFDELTGFLQSIDKFEKSAAGQAKLGQLFQVHKKEILAILDLIPPIAKSLASIYGTVAPGLVIAVTTVIRGAVNAISALAKLKIGKVDFGAWGVGIFLIALRLTGLGKAITGLASTLGKAALAGSLGALGKLLGNTKLGNWVSKLSSALGGSGKVSFSASVEAFGGWVTRLITGTGGGTGGTGGGIFGTGKGAAAEEETIGSKIATAFGVLAAGAIALSIGYAIGNAINKKFNISKILAPHFETPPATAIQTQMLLLGKLSAEQQTAGVLNTERGLYRSIAAEIKGMTPADLQKLLSQLNNAQQGELEGLMKQLGIHVATKMGEGVAVGLYTGITISMPTAIKAMQALVQAIINAGNTGFVSHSPSQVMSNMGRDVVLGLSQGITANTHMATTSMTTLANAMLKDFRLTLPQFKSLGAQVSASMATGLRTSPVSVRGGFAGASANITINSHPNIYVTAMGNNVTGTTKAIEKALEQHDQEFIRKILAGTSGRTTSG